MTITYSSGVGTISLDDFVGQKLTFAQRKLGNAGLNVDVITQEVTQESQDGIVLSQAPGASTKLSPGDRVTLTVGDYIEPIRSTRPPRPRPRRRRVARREDRRDPRRSIERAPRCRCDPAPPSPRACAPPATRPSTS